MVEQQSDETSARDPQSQTQISENGQLNSKSQAKSEIQSPAQ